MSNYVKATNFLAKDGLPSGDPNKIIRGSEFDVEFNNIAASISTKSDSSNGSFTGTTNLENISFSGNLTGTGITNTPVSGSTGSFTTLSYSTSLSGAQASFTDVNFSGNMSGGAITATPISGSTGSFTTLSFSGGLTGNTINTTGNITSGGSLSATGNVSATNFSATGNLDVVGDTYIQGNVTIDGTLTGTDDTFKVVSNRPSIRPSLNLDFVNQQVVDRRIVVNRNSPKTYFGREKVLGDENLIRYSEAFDNGVWANVGTPVRTANTDVAPDGTLTADTIADNSTTGFEGISQVVSISQPVIYSIYIKKTVGATFFPYVEVRQGNTFNNIIVNTDTGEVLPIESGTSLTYKAVDFFGSIDSGDYWRVYLKTEFTGSVQFNFFPAVDSVFKPTFEISNSVLTGSQVIWGAQLETAREGQTKPTAYVRTDAYPVRTFFNKLQTAPANTMPVEFDPVTQECLGIKPESQQTNLLRYSEEFDNAVYTKTGTTIDTNTIVTPNGLISGERLYSTNGTGITRVDQSVTPSASMVLSVYAKFSGAAYLWLGSAQFAGYQSYFNIQTGETGATPAGFTSAIENIGGGWYRCSVQFNAISPNSIAYISIGYSDTDGGLTASTGNGIYIWGAQLEQSTLGLPSSYIPTQNASVTRLADDLSMPVSAFEYNQNEGTLYAEVNFDPFVNGSSVYALFDINDGTNQNSLRVTRSDGGSLFGAIGTAYGNLNISQGGLLIDQKFVAGVNRVVLTYARNSIGVFINGELIQIDTLAEIPNNLTTLSIFQIVTKVNQLNSNGSAIRYYPKALNALEAQSLSQV